MITHKIARTERADEIILLAALKAQGRFTRIDQDRKLDLYIQTPGI